MLQGPHVRPRSEAASTILYQACPPRQALLAWSSKLTVVAQPKPALFHHPTQRQCLTCRSQLPGSTPNVASFQGQDDSGALQDNFHSLKAELDELAAALHRPEHRSTSQSQIDRSMQRMQPQKFHTSSNSEAHAVFQGEPFSSSNSRHWWYQAAEPPSDTCNEPLQHAQQDGTAQAGEAPHADVYELMAGMHQQQGGHSQSDLAAPDAQLRNYQEYSCTEREGCQGPKRGSGGRQSPSTGSILGCSSVQSLPVLNNSFIVPAQPVKPKKVDRVTRYRSNTTAGLALFTMHVLA